MQVLYSGGDEESRTLSDENSKFASKSTTIPNPGNTRVGIKKSVGFERAEECQVRTFWKLGLGPGLPIFIY